MAKMTEQSNSRAAFLQSEVQRKEQDIKKGTENKPTKEMKEKKVVLF